MHDGAVIISSDRILAARCVLPVTEKEQFPAHFGMRHRAAVGITEISDALAVIVSEQTGAKKRIQDNDPFWQSAGATALDKIWGNPDDNVYAELLKK